MIVIRSARARRILRYLIPFFIIPALLLRAYFCCTKGATPSSRC